MNIDIYMDRYSQFHDSDLVLYPVSYNFLRFVYPISFNVLAESKKIHKIFEYYGYAQLQAYMQKDPLQFTRAKRQLDILLDNEFNVSKLKCKSGQNHRGIILDISEKLVGNIVQEFSDKLENSSVYIPSFTEFDKQGLVTELYKFIRSDSCTKHIYKSSEVLGTSQCKLINLGVDIKIDNPYNSLSLVDILKVQSVSDEVYLSSMYSGINEANTVELSKPILANFFINEIQVKSSLVRTLCSSRVIEFSKLLEIVNYLNAVWFSNLNTDERNIVQDKFNVFQDLEELRIFNENFYYFRDLYQLVQTTTDINKLSDLYKITSPGKDMENLDNLLINEKNMCTLNLINALFTVINSNNYVFNSTIKQFNCVEKMVYQDALCTSFSSTNKDDILILNSFVLSERYSLILELFLDYFASSNMKEVDLKLNMFQVFNEIKECSFRLKSIFTDYLESAVEINFELYKLLNKGFDVSLCSTMYNSEVENKKVFLNSTVYDEVPNSTQLTVDNDQVWNNKEVIQGEIKDHSYKIIRDSKNIRIGSNNLRMKRNIFDFGLFSIYEIFPELKDIILERYSEFKEGITKYLGLLSDQVVSELNSELHIVLVNDKISYMSRFIKEHITTKSIVMYNKDRNVNVDDKNLLLDKNTTEIFGLFNYLTLTRLNKNMEIILQKLRLNKEFGDLVLFKDIYKSEKPDLVIKIDTIILDSYKNTLSSCCLNDKFIEAVQGIKELGVSSTKLLDNINSKFLTYFENICVIEDNKQIIVPVLNIISKGISKQFILSTAYVINKVISKSSVLGNSIKMSRINQFIELFSKQMLKEFIRQFNEFNKYSSIQSSHKEFNFTLNNEISTENSFNEIFKLNSNISLEKLNYQFNLNLYNILTSTNYKKLQKVLGVDLINRVNTTLDIYDNDDILKTYVDKNIQLSENLNNMIRRIKELKKEDTLIKVNKVSSTNVDMDTQEILYTTINYIYNIVDTLLFNRNINKQGGVLKKEFLDKCFKESEWFKNFLGIRISDKELRYSTKLNMDKNSKEFEKYKIAILDSVDRICTVFSNTKHDMERSTKLIELCKAINFTTDYKTNVLVMTTLLYYDKIPKQEKKLKVSLFNILAKRASRIDIQRIDGFLLRNVEIVIPKSVIVCAKLEKVCREQNIKFSELLREWQFNLDDTTQDILRILKKQGTVTGQVMSVTRNHNKELDVSDICFTLRNNNRQVMFPVQSIFSKDATQIASILRDKYKLQRHKIDAILDKDIVANKELSTVYDILDNTEIYRILNKLSDLESFRNTNTFILGNRVESNLRLFDKYTYIKYLNEFKKSNSFLGARSFIKNLDMEKILYILKNKKDLDYKDILSINKLDKFLIKNNLNAQYSYKGKDVELAEFIMSLDMNPGYAIINFDTMDSQKVLKKFEYFKKYWWNICTKRGIYINDGILLELWRRWYFMPPTGPFDKMVLPLDYPYATKPFNGQTVHPFPGSDKGIIEVPVSISIISNVIDFCYKLWEANYTLYTRFTGKQTIKHFVTQLFDWLDKYSPDVIYQLPEYYPDDYKAYVNEESYREDYWRIYRWIRWYSESVYTNKSTDALESTLDGNPYIQILIDDLINYYNMHHGIYYKYIAKTINKVKGVRHKWLRSNKWEV